MPPRAIKAIFFTRFHHERGSHVLHQVPEGSITSSSPLSPSALPQPLFDFDAISQYIIPTQQFCDRLITVCTNSHRIIGYPVCVREGKYSRNEYIFNFALVVEEACSDWAAYGDVARKMGRLLRGLEEQGGFLSGEEGGVVLGSGHGGAGSPAGGEHASSSAELHVRGGYTSKVYALCEIVLEDLNNYAECMIPIDDSNTINLKLFPAHPPPPPIHTYQVPLLTISLSSLTSPISSDLTLTRVLPFIDGINSVAKIAVLADADLGLTRKAIQHLAYYGCLVLLDVFQFGAVYASTAGIGAFVTDCGLQEECARYIAQPGRRGRGTGKRVGSNTSGGQGKSAPMRREDSLDSIRSGSRSTASRSSAVHLPSIRSSDSVATLASIRSTSNHSLLSPRDAAFAVRRGSLAPSPSNEKVDVEDEHFGAAEAPLIPLGDLIALYTSLRQGVTLRSWVLDNVDKLHNIDIRRFITFGLVKGFLYRVHKYALYTGPTAPPAPPSSLQGDEESAQNAGWGRSGQVGPEGRESRHGTQTPTQLHPQEPIRGRTLRGRERERERDRDADSDTATIRGMSHHRHPHKASLVPPTTTTTTIHSGIGGGSSQDHRLQDRAPQNRPQDPPHLSRTDSNTLRASPTKEQWNAAAVTAAAGGGPATIAGQIRSEWQTGMSAGGGKTRDALPLVKFLDGMHSFDEICTEVGAGEGFVEEKVRGLGDVGVFYR